ncbi:unnamed protein product, partial [Meganyctiphanes norvegica]
LFLILLSVLGSLLFLPSSSSSSPPLDIVFPSLPDLLPSPYLLPSPADLFPSLPDLFPSLPGIILPSMLDLFSSIPALFLSPELLSSYSSILSVLGIVKISFDSFSKDGISLSASLILFSLSLSSFNLLSLSSFLRPSL